MRRRLISILRIIAFICVTMVMLILLQKLLMPKYQRGIIEGSMIEEYYQAEEPHEVIILGDCEVYENISTVTLFEEYGISSYIRGSAQQLTWQSYYLLEDTLRYETPKVVVFNVLGLKYGEPQSEAYNRMTLDGMRFSTSKIKSIEASMLDSESMLDYLFPILRYHSRWDELTATDWECLFTKDRVTANGYYLRADCLPQGEFPPPPTLEDYSLSDNSIAYLSMMADLCEENNIELLLIKAPVEYPYWYEEWDLEVALFAESRGLNYINMIPLQEEIGLDMTTDTYDAGLHLNVYGAEKLASFLGEYLTTHYELTDYRNDAYMCSIWDEISQFYDNMLEAQLRELEEYGELRSWGVNAI